MVCHGARLIHPALGKPGQNYLGDLTVGQLLMLAEKWSEICSNDGISERVELSALLVQAEDAIYVITQKGKLKIVPE